MDLTRHQFLLPHSSHSITKPICVYLSVARKNIKKYTHDDDWLNLRNMGTKKKQIWISQQKNHKIEKERKRFSHHSQSVSSWLDILALLKIFFYFWCTFFPRHTFLIFFFCWQFRVIEYEDEHEIGW